MMAVILAGGKGTRLRPFTFSIPKPLLPLGDVPILEIVISQLAHSGFKRIVLTLGHMASYFPSILGNGDKWGISLEYCVEDQPLGTAGALGMVNNLEENVLVINGDILTNLDFAKVMRIHVARGAWATIAVTTRFVEVDFGVTTIGENGMLKDYLEKPKISYEVSTGINFLSRRSLCYIPKNKRFDMPDLLMSIQRSGNPVLCHRFNDYWKDVGRFEDYQEASADFVKDPNRFLKLRNGDS